MLTGQATQKPRQQIMTENVDSYLGMALGQLYVKRYFDENSKKRVLSLVNNLQKAFENRISQLDWMSDSTKVKAKEKLYAITKKLATRINGAVTTGCRSVAQNSLKTYFHSNRTITKPAWRN